MSSFLLPLFAVRLLGVEGSKNEEHFQSFFISKKTPDIIDPMKLRQH